jgi:hypothetical protein
MSLVIKLSGVNFTNASLPKLVSDYESNGLEVLYRMDHNIISDVIIDSSGNENHGINQGATKSIDGFNFADAYIDTDHLMKAEHTLFAVIKMTPGNRNFQFIISALGQSSQLYFSGNGDPSVAAVHDTGTVTTTHNSEVVKSVIDDQWLFVSLSTKDGKQETYFPQISYTKSTTVVSDAAIGASTTKTRVGWLPSSGYDKFFGDMAVVGIYDKAMTQSQMAELFAAAKKQLSPRGITLNQIV